MFPSFQEWCDTVLHPEDTHPWNFRTKEFYEEYKSKYAITEMVRPTSILEIGVRFGYGAYSFLRANPRATYVGLDMDEPSWGPYNGVPREWAERNLREFFPRAAVLTYHFDTRKNSYPETIGKFEMMHIDGGHSYECAMNDFNKFWPHCDRVMVVDDYNEILEVKCATEEFVAKHPEALLLTSASLRGSAIIVRDT